MECCNWRRQQDRHRDGAGSGIGRATALRLAREGARVVAADIAADRLTQLAADHPDLDLVPGPADLAAEEGTQAVVAAAGGRVDALANVAGIMDAFLPPRRGRRRHLGTRLRGQRHPGHAPDPGGAAAHAGGRWWRSSTSRPRRACAPRPRGGLHRLQACGERAHQEHRGLLQGPGDPRQRRGAWWVVTNLEAPFKSEHAARTLGPIMQAIIPPVATAEQLAATISGTAGASTPFWAISSSTGRPAGS